MIIRDICIEIPRTNLLGHIPETGSCARSLLRSEKWLFPDGCVIPKSCVNIPSTAIEREPEYIRVIRTRPLSWEWGPLTYVWTAVVNPFQPLVMSLLLIAFMTFCSGVTPGPKAAVDSAVPLLRGKPECLLIGTVSNDTYAWESLSTFTPGLPHAGELDRPWVGLCWCRLRRQRVYETMLKMVLLQVHWLGFCFIVGSLSVSIFIFPSW